MIDRDSSRMIYDRPERSSDDTIARMAECLSTECDSKRITLVTRPMPGDLKNNFLAPRVGSEFHGRLWPTLPLLRGADHKSHPHLPPPMAS
jgi:hypothetical protein